MANINTKLEYWKNRLLDLGKRNRLINCALPKSSKRVSRTFLLINQPDYMNLWSLFSESDKALEFPVPTETNEDEEINENLFGVFCNGITTNQTSNEKHKTLRSLMKKAKEFNEEKGLNALYLAFGFLNWKENGKDGQEMRSPLLLVPVKLAQEDLFSPILLSRLDDEITSNYCLEQKLLSDFGVELPDLSDDADLNDYFNCVRKAVGPLGWSVSTDVTQLALFSFMKINMYRDLERNADKITAHHIVRSLNGDTFKDNVDISDISDYKHDNTEPQEVYSVVDADSSQQDAILLAKRGVSFVLQGPPGTGKSQTITNIITELIADGKKVLFVSEKMAALEVVYKRLSHAGLADFCLTLHSHNAKRREILDQFDRSIKMSRQRVSLQQDALNKLYRLKETRKKLNKYSEELHTVVEPLGKTIYQVNGLIAQLETYQNIDYVQTNVEAFTQELLEQCEIALEELQRIVSQSGYQQKNPWKGCVLTQWTHEFKQQFIVETNKLIMLLNSGVLLFKDFNILFGINKDWSYIGVIEITNILTFSEKSPNVPFEWCKLTLGDIKALILMCQETLVKKDTIFVRLHDVQPICDDVCKKVQSSETITNTIDNAETLKKAFISYNEQLFLHNEILKQKFDKETELKELADKTIVAKNSSGEVTNKCENAYIQWTTAKTNLLKLYDEDILNLDLTHIIPLFRTTYRSWFGRMNGGYRQNHKTLLTYYKTAKKLKYEDCLLLLDKLSNLQILKAEYEKLAVNKEYAEKLYDVYSKEYTECNNIIEGLCSDITDGDVKLQTEKQNTISAIKDFTAEINQTFDKVNAEFVLQSNELGNLLSLRIEETYNFDGLAQKIEWLIQFEAIIKLYLLGDAFIKPICECNRQITELFREKVDRLRDWKKEVTPWLDKFAILFGEDRKDMFYRTELVNIIAKAKNCNENFAELQYLIDYRKAEKQLKALGIDAYLAKAKEMNLINEEVTAVFKKCFYRYWLDAVVPKFTAVNEFRRNRQDECIESFKKFDKLHMEISKANLISRLISHLPNFDTFGSNGEVALLRREMAKQRKLMPIRKLIMALPNLLPALKPCVMMSPLSVSTYLGDSSYEFDIVIFDEASQVRTEDAISAIFRAKQVIIAGDSKQLPPTDFFNSSISNSDEFAEDEEGEVDDTGAYESLLDEATLLPTQTLLWHYRSRHEHLIFFSNAKIYQGNLITFPSSVEKSDGMGVEYVHVSSGIYDRGGKNGNKAEAAVVADLVFEHFKKYPNRSLGIIAFGEVQQSAIQDALIEKRYANPIFEPFFKEDKEESLFIKNLETVQGDERDTIIFSIGYAPDKTGKFIMNFGPLSRNGGERRLNVAVTRARYNLKLVGSILPTDIDFERTNGQGPKLLRLYIDFAINGANAIHGESTADTALIIDSPFESSVYNFLMENGFNVSTQVGCSGYRIDMAVRDPKNSGRFAIGIECDGAMYHSARTARERDRLRQTVLEDMGWKIYRVWSTDWIKDQHTEGERLISAVNQAIDDYYETAPSLIATAKEKVTDFLNVQTVSVDESIREGMNEKFANVRSYYCGLSAKEIPTCDFAKTMLKVLQNNFGLDKAGLFKETAQYGYGWERQGNAIKQEFELTFTSLLLSKKIEEQEGKLKLL